MATLLLIDDDRAVHDTVERPLADMVDGFLHATTPEEGLRLALSEVPDVILLDVNMPRIDGLKLCALLKETPTTRDVPVLFVTVEDDAEKLARAFDVGGADYILKPFSDVELRARVRVALRTKRVMDLLKEQARVDALTGLGNRAALDASLASAVASYERNGQPVSLMIIDLDGFKQVNDGHGHGIGDELLRRVGACLRGILRPYDVACRYGGDEFVILLGQTEGRDARRAAERILSYVHGLEIAGGQGRIRAHASAGLATSADLRVGFAADDLLKAADRALYLAKHEGGDRLVDAALPEED
jgi:diguanylate cyclase (GGDEF)-like protein